MKINKKNVKHQHEHMTNQEDMNNVRTGASVKTRTHETSRKSISQRHTRLLNIENDFSYQKHQNNQGYKELVAYTKSALTNQQWKEIQCFCFLKLFHLE